MSRPQAITVANLTDSQIKQLIAQHPPQVPSATFPDNGKFTLSPPLIPLYLPDPESSKFRDDYIAGQEQRPIKLNLSLDPYALPLNVPADRFSPNIEDAEDDKSPYSYQDRYDYYQPMPVVVDKNHKYGAKEYQLMEMQPPVLANAPNYYAVKPKKIPKKYQPNKKDVNVSKTKSSGTDKLVPIDNDGLVLRRVSEDRTLYVTSPPVERFAPAPSWRRELTEDDLNTGEYFPNVETKTEAITLDSTVPTLMIDAATAASAKIEKRNEVVDAGELNANSMGGRLRNDERVEFQMHGFNGPNSYKFGFDTGLG